MTDDWRAIPASGERIVRQINPAAALKLLAMAVFGSPFLGVGLVCRGMRVGTIPTRALTPFGVLFLGAVLFPVAGRAKVNLTAHRPKPSAPIARCAMIDRTRWQRRPAAAPIPARGAQGGTVRAVPETGRDGDATGRCAGCATSADADADAAKGAVRDMQRGQA